MGWWSEMGGEGVCEYDKRENVYMHITIHVFTLTGGDRGGKRCGVWGDGALAAAAAAAAATAAAAIAAAAAAAAAASCCSIVPSDELLAGAMAAPLPLLPMQASASWARCCS